MHGPIRERRRTVRRRSLLGATIATRWLPSTTECVVRDLSEDGARLVLSETVPLPGRFGLAIAHRREDREADVVWRAGDEVGIAFGRRTEDTAPVPLGMAREVRALRAENAALRARLSDPDPAG